MAGLCEGGNESPGSLKASNLSAAGLVVRLIQHNEATSNQPWLLPFCCNTGHSEAVKLHGDNRAVAE
ncbi:hypothetical protein ANN_03350 [Periplaneta americana]|uniref:Uncharacterized protein n=1 Tax=Periplaneta americana TaxID=6978 RepID=A0ABQ8TYT4_PERAM|nr:hypothetical protein ANN_03350 [Periplaneta americana]